MNKAKQRKKSTAYHKLRILTRSCTLETWESWIVDIENGKPVYDIVVKDNFGIKRGSDFVRAARTVSRKWLIKIRVLCRTHDGQEYIEETELEADNLKLDEFNDIFKEYKTKTIEGCNPNHVKDVGWWAKALS